jgi:hypothetical protein
VFLEIQYKGFIMLQWLKRLRSGLFSPNQKASILVLGDTDNIIIESLPADHTKYSIESGLDKMFRWLGKIGQAEQVFFFGPIQSIDDNLEVFRKFGIYSIVCPRVVVDKGVMKNKKKDTVDPTLIAFGTEMIRKTRGLTHLCLCSGDQDFMSLVRYARRMGLDIIIVGASWESLARDLADLASCDATGKKLIYIFSPTTGE